MAVTRSISTAIVVSATDRGGGGTEAIARTKVRCTPTDTANRQAQAWRFGGRETAPIGRVTF